MPRATSASSRPSQLARLPLTAAASAMPAEVHRTMAKSGSAATGIVMKTSRPISPLQSRSLRGREFRPFREPMASESGCECREASPTAHTLFAANYGFASARPKIATALLQPVIGLPQAIGGWSGRRDSNSRPPTWKAGALPTELLPRRGRYFIPRAGATLRAVVDPGLAFGVDLFLPD